jgi:SAM-dependent methyltransferase
MTQDGRIRAKMQDKFWQINHFLQLISQTADLDQLAGSPLQVVDCGCGSAYLTFATYHYLTTILKRPTRLTGIDVKKDLLDRRAKQAQSLGWSGLTFKASRIIDFEPPTPPDIVLALHACDTATDEALAQAIKWQSQLIFSVPCCHHHLQAQLSSVGQIADLSQKPLLRHGILKERLGDILTDAFRALILRIMGYRTDVVEFISSEHTARNLMIRAVKSTRPGHSQFVREYEKMKECWGVKPYLETLIGEAFIDIVRCGT